MSTSIKLPDELIKAARRYAGAFGRSIPKQIEHWSRIGRIAEENPDLPYGFIRQLLLALAEEQDGDVTDFHFRAG
jgi:hypothetical protein